MVPTDHARRSRTFVTCFENLALKGNPLSLQLHSLLHGDILLYGAQLVTLNMAGQCQYKCCLQAIDLNHLVLGIGTWMASSETGIRLVRQLSLSQF